MTQVKQMVDRQLYFVLPSEMVSEVTRRMSELRIGTIVVMEDGRLSMRDLMHFELARIRGVA